MFDASLQNHHENINSFIQVLARTMAQNVEISFMFFSVIVFSFFLSHTFFRLAIRISCVFFPGVISPSIFQIQCFPELSHIIFCFP